MTAIFLSFVVVSVMGTSVARGGVVHRRISLRRSETGEAPGPGETRSVGEHLGVCGAVAGSGEEAYYGDATDMSRAKVSSISSHTSGYSSSVRVAISSSDA